MNDGQATFEFSPLSDEKRVEGILRARRGFESAISRADLCRQTRLSDRRARKCIERLARAGVPVGRAPGGGYCWLTTREEMAYVVGDLAKKGTAIFRRMRALVGHEAAAAMWGQMPLLIKRKSLRQNEQDRQDTQDEM